MDRERRNQICERIFVLGDRLNEKASEWRCGYEYKLWQKIYNRLPTPANLLYWASKGVHALAWKVHDPCPACDSWPCRCQEECPGGCGFTYPKGRSGGICPNCD